MDNLRMKFQKALCTLLQSNRLCDISVSNLCHTAKASRSSFYNLYGGEFESMVDEIIQVMFDNIVQGRTLGTTRKFRVASVLSEIKKNIPFYSACCCDEDVQTIVMTKANRTIYDFIYGNVNVLETNNDFKLTCYYYYTAYGLLACVKRWIDNNCQIPIEDMADILDDLIA